MIFSRWRVPAWSAFTDRKSHDAFLEVVHDRLRELDRSWDQDDDGPVLSVGGGASLDLAALSVAAASEPPEQWPETVRGAVASATNPNRPPSDPDRLRPTVRSRLMTVEAHARFPKELPHRRHADLAEVLVIETPRGLVWADAQDLASLELSLDQLFTLGRDNVRTRERIATTTVDIGDASVTIAEGATDGIATWALLLDDLLDEGTAQGAVVAVPTRRMLMVSPLDGAADADLEALAGVAADRAAAGPGSLSPRLYRWQDGELSLHG